MTDPIPTSTRARESLARGLQALQADATVPPHLVELASPIAQAMGALHRIEQTREVVPHAEVALGLVRAALAQLQAQTTNHPAVNTALEAVAASLGLVHSLTVPARPVEPKPAAPAPAPQQAAPAPAPAPAVAAKPEPIVTRDPFAPPPAAAPPQAAPAPKPVVAAPPAGPNVPVPAPPAGSLPLLTADLGTHSPTNFYKGLSGNDIIEHGGLFVSTYAFPAMNTAVRLHVSLPGGYEFEANAIVRWTRDDGGPDAPPGFGAQFTSITPEAKQLVYRYVRNREPIFHDDF